MYLRTYYIDIVHLQFSSPFIEERLYFISVAAGVAVGIGFSSPFIEERLYFETLVDKIYNQYVLVPFYRGAVVFKMTEFDNVREALGSRPLLSRSGCI